MKVLESKEWDYYPIITKKSVYIDVLDLYILV